MRERGLFLEDHQLTKHGMVCTLVCSIALGGTGHSASSMPLERMGSISVFLHKSELTDTA